MPGENLPYDDMVFTPFDPLTAAEQNQLVSNIESLAAGTGMDDHAITDAEAVQTFTNSDNDDGSIQTMTSGAWNDVTGLGFDDIDLDGDVPFGFTIPVDNTSSAGTGLFRVLLDTSTVLHKASFSPGSVGPRHHLCFNTVFTGITPGSHDIKVQGRMLAGGGATLRFFVGQSSIYAAQFKK